MEVFRAVLPRFPLQFTGPVGHSGHGLRVVLDLGGLQQGLGDALAVRGQLTERDVVALHGHRESGAGPRGDGSSPQSRRLDPTGAAYGSHLLLARDVIARSERRAVEAF
jgi:hypothetical protein